MSSRRLARAVTVACAAALLGAVARVAAARQGAQGSAVGASAQQGPNMAALIAHPDYIQVGLAARPGAFASRTRHVWQTS